MISAQLQNALREEYFKSFKGLVDVRVPGGRHFTTVFKNPSADEWKQAQGGASKSARGFIDDHDLYVWDADADTHGSALIKSGINVKAGLALILKAKPFSSVRVKLGAVARHGEHLETLKTWKDKEAYIRRNPQIARFGKVNVVGS
jgi:hypothetical protein